MSSKTLLSLLFVILFSNSIIAQTKQPQTFKLDPSKKTQIVEVSCGQCQFKLKGKKGCDLAVRIKGKSYFVDGAHIDSFGDAHGSDGFCEAIRKAEVQGEIVNNRFETTYMKILPSKTIKKRVI